MRQSILQKWWLQVLFWLLLFLPFHLLVSIGIPTSYDLREFVSQAIVPIFLFYIVYNVLVPKYFLQKKYGLFFIYLFLTISACVTVSFPIAFYFLSHTQDPIDNFSNQFLLDAPYKLLPILFLNFFIVAFISSTLKIIYEQWNERERLLEREREHLSSELLLLKSQINPHFLLNTLNNLYALTEIDTQKTQTAILQLADLLRYVLYESKQEKVSLTDEIRVLYAYIALHQIKYKKPLNIVMTIDLDNSITSQKKHYIEPMLLIPIIENAFKHSGVGVIADAFIKGNIFVDTNNHLTIVFKNSISTISTTVIDAHSGIGLTNIARRLAILYPDKEVVFSYQVIDKYFETKLVF